MINFKILSLATVATLALGFTPAQANDLLDNSASGFVEGNVIMDTERYSNYSYNQTEQEVLVGGIAVRDMAFYNSSQGVVSGDITQVASTDTLEAKIHVGSIKANNAERNNAIGTVNGNIDQFIGEWSQAVISIGTIDTDTFAFNNRAEGYVDGYVYQDASGAGVSSLLNVGSVTSSETLR